MQELAVSSARSQPPEKIPDIPMRRFQHARRLCRQPTSALLPGGIEHRNVVREPFEDRPLTSIPYLCFHHFPINIYRTCRELDADRRLGIEVEFISRES